VGYNSVADNRGPVFIRILEQVGPAAGPKVVWQGLELLVNYYRPNNYIGVKEGGVK